MAITISNQDGWGLTEWSRLTQLLRKPSARRMRGVVQVNDSSGGEFNDEEEILWAKQPIDQRQAIAGPNVFGMMREKN